MQRPLILAALLFSPTLAGAQHFELLSLEDGLSQSQVTRIIQDSVGFMWFGTYNGLNRYDGKTFTVFKNIASDTTSLSDNWIRAVIEPKHTPKILWIGTRYGLNRFDMQSQTFSRYFHDPRDSTSISANGINWLYEDAWGKVWIATAKGLNRFDTRTQKFSRYLPHERIFSLCGNESGVWVAAGNSICEIALSGTGEIQNIQRMRGFPERIWFGEVGPMHRDAKGIIWIGARDRVFQLNTTTAAVTSVPFPAEVTDFSSDGNGVMWLGTFGRGLFLVDSSLNVVRAHTSDRSKRGSLSSNYVLSLWKDRVGRLWIGVTGSGLNIADPKKRNFPQFTVDPNNTDSLSKSVLAVYEDRAGIVWIGKVGGGIDRFDPTTNRFTNFRYNDSVPNTLPHHSVRFFREHTQRAKNELWLGTGVGVSLLTFASRGTPHFKNYVHNAGKGNSILPGPVLCGEIDGDGSRWFGTATGISRLDQNERFTHFVNDPNDTHSLSNNYLLVLLRDARGNLWAGTANGLNKFDRSTRSFTRYMKQERNPNSLSDNWVGTMYEHPPGTLWIGTRNGLNKFDPATERFEHFFEQDGLPNNTVAGILSDRKGNLWLSTFRGLSKFNPESRTFENFDTKDGLQSLEFNYGASCRGPSGKLYFGGIGGLNVFDPDSLLANDEAPRIVFTGFTPLRTPKQNATREHVPGSSITFADLLTLQYSQNDFEIGFAALNYTTPEKNRYAYMLEGFQTDWIVAGTKTSATFTNLDAGDYTFRVRGSNNDGVWNMEGASLPIRILPPFWETWWFRVVMLGAAVGILTLIYRYRISKSLEMERMRIRIASDLHDDVGSMLSKISMQAQLLAQRLDDDPVRAKPTHRLSDPARTHPQLERISEMCGNVVKAMGDVVWAIDARNDSTGSLIARMRDFALSDEPPVRVEFTTENMEQERALSIETRQCFYLIFKEALTNAIRHAHATRVIVALRYDHDGLHLIVHDDGKGFVRRTPHGASESPHNGHGLRNMKMRAEKIGAELQILNDNGTTITLSHRND